MSKLSLSIIFAAALLIGAVSAQSEGAASRELKAAAAAGPAANAYAGIIADPEFSTLAKLIQAGGTDPFIASLRDPTLSATIFAPTNTAFTRANAALKATIAGRNPAEIVRLLKEHVVVGQAVSGNQLKNGLILTSALGQKLSVATGYLYGTYIQGPKNRVRVTPNNNLVGRVYVHKVDGVLTPK